METTDLYNVGERWKAYFKLVSNHEAAAFLVFAERLNDLYELFSLKLCQNHETTAVLALTTKVNELIDLMKSQQKAVKSPKNSDSATK